MPLPDMIYTTLPESAGNDEPVTECFFLYGTKELLTSLYGVLQSLIHPETPALRVAHVPGKGMGLYSTRSLAESHLIVTERFFLLAPAGWDIPCPAEFTCEQYLQLTLNESEKAWS